MPTSGPQNGPEKKKYEYKAILFSGASASELALKIEEKLTKLGQDHWKVVNIQTPKNESNAFLSFFILLEREV